LTGRGNPARDTGQQGRPCILFPSFSVTPLNSLSTWAPSIHMGAIRCNRRQHSAMAPHYCESGKRGGCRRTRPQNHAAKKITAPAAADARWVRQKLPERPALETKVPMTMDPSTPLHLFSPFSVTIISPVHTPHDNQRLASF